MKKNLCLVYMELVRCIRKLKWIIQVICMHVSIENAEPIENEIKLNSENKILVIVPHADDELIGCYSIIKKYSKNVVVWYSGMTGDDTTEENKKTRKNEFLNFCSIMGVKTIICDGTVAEGLEKVFKEYNPAYIFVPSLIDWHCEHRKLFLLAKNITSGSETELFCYQVTVPIAQNFITHYSQLISDEQKTKWKIFKNAYVSQRFMPILRFKLSEHFYMKEKAHICAEVFMKYKTHCIKSEEQSVESYGEFDNMKIDINNLQKIRNVAEKKYDETFMSKGKMIGIEEIQNIETQMLAYINRVCQENNITYYIHAGTALGAIRHGGPIPWDDDVDIIVPITQIDDFIEVLNENLPQKYKLYNKEDNKYNQILFPRLCLNNNHPMTAYVDIFPLVGLPTNKRKQISFSKHADLINKYYRLKYKNVRETRNILKRVAIFVLKQFVCLIPFKCWQYVFDKHIRKYSYETAEYVMNPCGMKGTKNIIKKSIYGTPKYVKYSELELPIANKYEEYLKHYYGDYMKYPDESVVKKGLNVRKLYCDYGEK